MIKNAGVRAGVVLNPGTPVAAVEYVLSECDMVLVMTVNPGFGGQSFIPETLKKIEKLKQLKEANHYHYEIEVDGGIVPETAKQCKQAGADVFVAGSYVYNAEDPQKQIQHLKEALAK